jgi:hypothetical protein
VPQELELLGDLPCGQRAPRGALLQAGRDHRFQLGRQRGLQELRLPVQHRVAHLDGARSLERAAPGKHLEEHGAEHEQVGAPGHGLRAKLLGRHVASGPDDAPRAALFPVGARLGDGLAVRLFDELREPEVEDLRPAILVDKDVLRLQIAVDDAQIVGRLKPARDLGADVQRLRERHGACAKQLSQRRSAEQLGDQERLPVLLAHVVDGDDVRMRESAHRERLLAKAGERVGRGRGRGADLERYLTLELAIVRREDPAHAALADLAEHHIAACEDALGLGIFSAGNRAPHWPTAYRS